MKRFLLPLMIAFAALAFTACSEDIFGVEEMDQTRATTTVSLKVMQYNVKSARPVETSGHEWSKRKAAIAAYIKKEAPDVIAVQELYNGWTMNQYSQLNSLISSVYGGYIAYRGTTTVWDNEGCAIFYKKSRFSLVKTGKFWLSATPDKESKGWGGEYKRVTAWAILKDKTTSKEFFVISTHFEDWVQKDGNNGNCQYESTKVINARIKSLAGGRNVILMGDFNSNPDKTPAKMLQKKWGQGGTLVNARDICRINPSGNKYTTNNWDTADNTGAQFDYVMITDNGANYVSSHYTGNSYYNSVMMSDHNPLIVDVKFVY